MSIGLRPLARFAILATTVVVLLAVVLGIFELALRSFLPLPTAYYVQVPGLHAVFHPNERVTPGVSGAAHFDVCSLGVRAPRPPAADETVVLAVGGSTTEETILDQDETWTWRLRTLVGGPPALWVGNAGRSGHGTSEHLLQVRELLRLLPRTRVVVLLVGGNDFLRRLAEDAAFDPGAPQRPDFEVTTTPRAFALYPPLLRRDGPFWKRSELWVRVVRGLGALRLAWSARQGGLVQDEEVDAITAWREQRRHASALRDVLPDLGAAREQYIANLTEIVRRVRGAGAEPLLLTQPTIWRADLPGELVDLLWLGGVGDFQRPGVRSDYYTPRALAEGMARYNADLLDVCARANATCVDLAARVPKDGTMFYDDMHFTEAGAALVAREVSRALAPLLRQETRRAGD